MDARLRQLVEQDGPSEGSGLWRHCRPSSMLCSSRMPSLSPRTAGQALISTKRSGMPTALPRQAEQLRSLKQRLDQSDQAHQRQERQLQEHRLQLERLRVEHRQKMDQKQVIEERLGSPIRSARALRPSLRSVISFKQPHQLCETSGLAQGLTLRRHWLPLMSRTTSQSTTCGSQSRTGCSAGAVRATR